MYRFGGAEIESTVLRTSQAFVKKVLQKLTFRINRFGRHLGVGLCGVSDDLGALVPFPLPWNPVSKMILSWIGGGWRSHVFVLLKQTTLDQQTADSEQNKSSIGTCFQPHSYVPLAIN